MSVPAEQREVSGCRLLDPRSKAALACLIYVFLASSFHIYSVFDIQTPDRHTCIRLPGDPLARPGDRVQTSKTCHSLFVIRFISSSEPQLAPKWLNNRCTQVMLASRILSFRSLPFCRMRESFFQFCFECCSPLAFVPASPSSSSPLSLRGVFLLPDVLYIPVVMLGFFFWGGGRGGGGSVTECTEG